ncbi:MAG: phosphoribosylanthranilate isomerase [Lachnospiraceae bacterium]|nr:phosphoribosylanthranilate isomerase [Lachnospiraceae bacterium]
MSTKIKLCGMMQDADILTANELFPDYVGFVFAPGRARTVSLDAAQQFRKLLSSDISAVGVFRGNTLEDIAHIAASGAIDLIQLHGHETEDDIAWLRTQTNLPIIQAFRIEQPADIQTAERSSADYILLDSGNGGTGIAFDWSLLTRMKRPYFLAGGLRAENIETAIRRWRPCAVDISSGIETDGKKDPVKMKQIIRIIRELS